MKNEMIKTNAVLGTKVTFTSRDDVPVGLMDLSDMSIILDIGTISAVCDLFRQKFNEMGEPLDYTIEYVSKDI